MSPLIPRLPNGPLIIVLGMVPVKLPRRPPETDANGRLMTPMVAMPRLPMARRMLTALLLIGLHRLPTEQLLLVQPLALRPSDAAEPVLLVRPPAAVLLLVAPLVVPLLAPDPPLRDRMSLLEPLVHLLLTGAVPGLLYVDSSVTSVVDSVTIPIVPDRVASTFVFSLRCWVSCLHCW